MFTPVRKQQSKRFNGLHNSLNNTFHHLINNTFTLIIRILFFTFLLVLLGGSFQSFRNENDGVE